MVGHGDEVTEGGGGTTIDSDVGVAELTWANSLFKVTRLFVRVDWKFVPEMETVLPTLVTVVERPVTVGAFGPPTVNDDELVPVPDGDVTLIAPEVAPVGTVTTSWVQVADETVAVVPFNVTVSWLAVGEKFAPEIVTVVPEEPDSGENDETRTVPVVSRVTDVRLPVASYAYFAEAPVASVAVARRPASSYEYPIAHELVAAAGSAVLTPTRAAPRTMMTSGTTRSALPDTARRRIPRVRFDRALPIDGVCCAIAPQFAVGSQTDIVRHDRSLAISPRVAKLRA